MAHFMTLAFSTVLRLPAVTRDWYGRAEHGRIRAEPETCKDRLHLTALERWWVSLITNPSVLALFSRVAVIISVWLCCYL